MEDGQNQAEVEQRREQPIENNLRMQANQRHIHPLACRAVCPHEGAVACMRSRCEEPLVAVMAAAVAVSAAPMRAAVGVADAASRRMDAVR